MPQPYPGQQWKHGWKPLTPSAVKSKNHGKKALKPWAARHLDDLHSRPQYG